jgi:hypothetical protein
MVIVWWLICTLNDANSLFTFSFLFHMSYNVVKPWIYELAKLDNILLSANQKKMFILEFIMFGLLNKSSLKVFPVKLAISGKKDLSIYRQMIATSAASWTCYLPFAY